MADNDRAPVQIIIVVIACMFAAYLIGGLLVQENYQRQAIQRDFAQYCPGTGRWAWKGECPTTPTREKEE